MNEPTAQTLPPADWWVTSSFVCLSPLHKSSKGLWAETTYILEEKNEAKDKMNENIYLAY